MELLLHIHLPKVVIDTSIATVHPAASHAPCNAPYLNSSMTCRSDLRWLTCVSLLRDVASGAGRWKLRETTFHLTRLPSNSESYGMHGMQLLGLQKKPLWEDQSSNPADMQCQSVRHHQDLNSVPYLHHDQRGKLSRYRPYQIPDTRAPRDTGTHTQVYNATTTATTATCPTGNGHQIAVRV